MARSIGADNPRFEKGIFAQLVMSKWLVAVVAGWQAIVAGCWAHYSSMRFVWVESGLGIVILGTNASGKYRISQELVVLCHLTSSFDWL
jgi:hypothetical protein